MSCEFGLPLFSLYDNDTWVIIDRLEQFRASYEPYHGYVCVVICIFGILTNLINVVVLTKRQMRTSINVLLTGIALCDMGTMASYLVYIIHFVFASQLCNPNLYSYNWMLFLYCHFIFSVALHSTGLWLAVVMAFVRSMTLRRAMNGSKWLRSKNTWKICLFVYLCVFLLCVPSAFGNSIKEYPNYFNDTCDDEWSPDHEYTSYTIDILESRCHIFIITLWLAGMLFKIIPCLLLAVLITSLLWTIKKADRRRRALFELNTRARRRDGQQGPNSDRTSTMLVVILCLFLLTELPQGAISILSGIYVSDMRQFVYRNVGDILDLLSLINSAVNFVLYCAMSSRYRQVFWQVVLPRKVYIAWFLRPRPVVHSQTIAASKISDTRRPSRPEFQILTTIAQAPPRRQSDQETTILELYKANPDPNTRCELEDNDHEGRPGGSTRRCDLRKQALTRAAVLAATPAMLETGDEDRIDHQPNEDVLKITPSTDEILNPTSRRRRRWRISCSCLCKCACRRSPVEPNQQHPSVQSEPPMPAERNRLLDVPPTVQNGHRFYLSSALPLWRSRTGRVYL